METSRVLIFFALRDEAAPFVRFLRNHRREKLSTYREGEKGEKLAHSPIRPFAVSPIPLWRGRIGQTEIAVALTGIGLAAAERAATDLLAALPCSYVISAGYAGGLRANLKRGNIILPELVADEEQTYACDSSLITHHLSRFTHCSKLISVPRIIVASSEKRALHQRTGAEVVDMESAAIARVCRGKNIPFVVARIITDEVGEDLPVDFNVLLGKNQQPNPARAARYFLRHPHQLATTLSYRRQLKTYAHTLAEFLRDFLGPY